MNILNNSKNYRKFITERNKVLEYLLHYYLDQLDEVVAHLKTKCEQIIVHLHAIGYDMHQIEHALAGPFNVSAMKASQIAHRLRKTIYLLSYVGEVEGLARALKKPTKDVRFDANKIKDLFTEESPSGGSLNNRIAHGFKKLHRRVTSEVENVFMQKDFHPKDIITAIDYAFPKKRKVKRPGKKIQKPKKIREAKKPTTDADMLVTGFIDDQAWDDLVTDYLDANIPLRGPEDKTVVAYGEGTEHYTEERYSWEVEQELTQDFLEQVRGGQIDAAKENGIEDFVWVAIIDSRTDDCCLWRDGLTTSEIKSQLKGEHKDDECQTEVPPAHFNCRCDIAPVTKDTLEYETLDLGDFDTWLK